MKAIPAPTPMYGVMTEVGMKSYSRLTMALSCPTLPLMAVPGMLALVGTWP